MIKKKNTFFRNFVVSLIFVLIIAGGINLFLAKEDSTMIAKLITINDKTNTLTFKTRSNETRTTKAPQIIIPLLKVQNDYLVVIHKKKWEKAHVVEIKETNKPTATTAATNTP